MDHLNDPKTLHFPTHFLNSPFCSTLSFFRSLVLIGLLTIVGTGFATYIMAMAALSPCPLLVHSASGTALIVRLFLLLRQEIEKIHVLRCKVADNI